MHHTRGKLPYARHAVLCHGLQPLTTQQHPNWRSQHPTSSRGPIYRVLEFLPCVLLSRRLPAALYNAAARKLAQLSHNIQLRISSDRHIATRKGEVAAGITPTIPIMLLVDLPC